MTIELSPDQAAGVSGIGIAPQHFVLKLPVVRENVNAVRLRELTSRFELLLEQAEGFARGGDYLGGQARARYAHQGLTEHAASAGVADAEIAELRRHLEVRLRHYDLLAKEWQQENVARQVAYLTRERGAIGANVARAGDVGRRMGLITALHRLWTGAFGRWKPGAMRMGSAP
jgi:hypothetical protein